MHGIFAIALGAIVIVAVVVTVIKDLRDADRANETGERHLVRRTGSGS